MNGIYDDANGNEIEVELAGGWERIGAALLNNVFTMLAGVPAIMGLVFGMLQARERFPVESWEELSSEEQFEVLSISFSSTWFLLGVLVLVIYTIIQCYLMSRDGQSLGKKMLDLKVIKENGDDAGFVGVVLLREIVFNLGFAVIIGVIGALLSVGDGLANLLGYVPSLICVIMLFATGDKRTLQDWIAGTVVVKLPRQRKVRRR